MFAESDKFFYPGILPYLRKRGNKSHDDTHHTDHEQAHLPVLRQRRGISGRTLGYVREGRAGIPVLEMSGLPPGVADKEERGVKP